MRALAMIYLIIIQSMASAADRAHDHIQMDLSTKQGAQHEMVQDDRIVVDFPQPIKQAMMTRMRRNLSDIHAIQNALANGDYETAASIAEFSLGLSSLGPHNARQAPYMPEPMRQVGMAMHAASSRVALAAQEGDSVSAFKKLSEVTALCVSCHAMYRAK